MKLVATCILLLLLLFWGQVSLSEETDGARPNILLLITDDQRADLEEAEAAMPALRRYFAEDGTRFRNAYVTTPLCCPSRASIFTGQYAHNHGVLTNDDVQNLRHETTFQAKLQAAGYKTAYVGKFLNHWPMEIRPPYFDWWATAKYQAKYRERRHSNSLWNVNGEMINEKRYGSRATGSRANQFLRLAEGRENQPWLLIVSVFEPHSPFSVEPKYAEAEVLVPDAPDKENAIQQLRMLMSVDDMINDILTELERLDEEALSIYISDNGILLGEHGMVNRKGVPYEAAVRVPLYVRWPGYIESSDIREDDLVANIDIASTILEAAGLPADGLDGRSLLHPSTRDKLLLEGFGERTWMSLLSRSWQYIEFRDKGRFEYYGSEAPFSSLPMELEAVLDCQGSECYLE